MHGGIGVTGPGKRCAALPPSEPGDQRSDDRRLLPVPTGRRVDGRPQWTSVRASGSGKSILNIGHSDAEAERAAMRELIARRRAGPFVETGEARARTEAMIARKRKERDL